MERYLKPYSQEWVTIYHGDSREILPALLDNSVDLLATDPPYGISFMGKDWDKALPDKAIWAECLRILKPGAFAFVMSIPRVDCLSRMIIALEDAGFWVNFTPIFHAFASGFPKSQNIGKAVDKRYKRRTEYDDLADYIFQARQRIRLSTIEVAELGKFYGTINHGGSVANWENGKSIPSQRQWEVLKEILKLDSCFDWLIEQETKRWEGAEREVTGRDKTRSNVDNIPFLNRGEFDRKDKPATPQAKALDGSYGGFQPKPAVEVIIVAMKPLSEKTFVDQALKNRKGITWLDDCRIPYESEVDKEAARFGTQMDIRGGNLKTPRGIKAKNVLSSQSGRFPANLLVSDDVLNDGSLSKSGKDAIRRQEGMFLEHKLGGLGYPQVSHPDSGSFSRYFDLDKWWEERIKQLPQSVQRTFPFLIVPKASKSEKDKGLDMPEVIKSGLPLRDGSGDYVENEYGDGSRSTRRTRIKNYHPTVKPLKLMSYLITLGSREGDIVLDPFIGSGTTALACKMMSRKCIGIEIEEKYCEIATNRCRQQVLL